MGKARCPARFLIARMTIARSPACAGEGGCRWTVPWFCIGGYMAYLGAQTSCVGYGRTEGQNHNHMVKGMATQNVCLWDFR